eukprot:gene29208-biopygen27932
MARVETGIGVDRFDRDRTFRKPFAPGGDDGCGTAADVGLDRSHIVDRQIADLAAYLRGRFAPEKPAWNGIEDAVAKGRKAAH